MAILITKMFLKSRSELLLPDGLLESETTRPTDVPPRILDPTADLREAGSLLPVQF